MADQQETTIEIDSTEMFRSALADEPAPATKPEQEEKPAGTEGDRPRDELGRFAPKTEEQPKPEPVKVEAQPQPTPTPQPETEGGQVPSWRLKEVSDARRAAEQRAEQATREAYQFRSEMDQMRRQLESLQRPKETPVDFFQDPDKALQQRMSPVQENFASLQSEVRLGTSKAINIAIHGAKAIEEAEAAVGKAMQERHPDMAGLSVRMQHSQDPVGEVVKWHKTQKLLEATGGDPEAYKAKALEEALKDPAFLAKAIEAARTQASAAAPGSRPNVVIPPSLNKASGTSGQDTAALSEEDMSHAALFKYATAPKRR